MVQLLLAISKEPESLPPKSDFALDYLKRKLRHNQSSELFVKPNLSEYAHADCALTERDKSLLCRQKYLDFTTTSFENPNFKSSLNEMQAKMNATQPYTLDSLEKAPRNLFNQALFDETAATSADSSQVKPVGRSFAEIESQTNMKPTALLGATLRSLTQADSVTNNKGGLFGASLSDEPQSTFGMTLQIPSLP